LLATCLGRHSGMPWIEHRLGSPQADRPASFDKGHCVQDFAIAQSLGGWHEGNETGGSRREPAVFDHVKDVFVGVLPSVTSLVMRRRTPAGVFVDQLPQRLPLQISPVAGRAVAHVNLFSQPDHSRIIGIGEMCNGAGCRHHSALATTSVGEPGGGGGLRLVTERLSMSPGRICNVGDCRPSGVRKQKSVAAGIVHGRVIFEGRIQHAVNAGQIWRRGDGGARIRAWAEMIAARGCR
jgi:hypothetical protein